MFNPFVDTGPMGFHLWVGVPALAYRVKLLDFFPGGKRLNEYTP